MGFYDIRVLYNFLDVIDYKQFEGFFLMKCIKIEVEDYSLKCMWNVFESWYFRANCYKCYYAKEHEIDDKSSK